MNVSNTLPEPQNGRQPVNGIILHPAQPVDEAIQVGRVDVRRQADLVSRYTTLLDDLPQLVAEFLRSYYHDLLLVACQPIHFLLWYWLESNIRLPVSW